MICCDFREKEFNHLKLFSTETIVYSNKCGYFYSDILFSKIDKTKYPVFRIKNFLVSSNDLVINFIRIIIIADIEGTISKFKNTTNSFEILTNIEKENINISTQMQCKFESPNRIKNNFIINCTILQN